jgi:uncharacterized alkaline shock family protein YloU
MTDPTDGQRHDGLEGDDLAPDEPELHGLAPDGLERDELDRDDLDGHSIEELSDYLDAGRTPRDESIESSPGCQIALASLERLRAAAWALIEAEADAEPERDSAWIGRLMGTISREARAGRDIPIASDDASVALSVTEGSVRGLIRAAGDEVGGVLIASCALDGDVTVPGEPVVVAVTASVAWGLSLPQLAAELRASITAALTRHTELLIERIDVTISDIHSASSQETR